MRASVVLLLVLLLTSPAAAQTLIRGQWNAHGSGSYYSATSVSNGGSSYLDIDGNAIPNGTLVGAYHNACWGTFAVNGQDLFANWNQGGVWDTTHNQFIAYIGNTGWAPFELNLFDVATGTWNPGGRPHRPYTELAQGTACVLGSWLPWPSNKVAEGNLYAPGSFVDLNNHYTDITDINPTLGVRVLPNAGHMSGQFVWMPSVQRAARFPIFGMHLSDQGRSNSIWEWDPATKKWAGDFAPGDYPSPNDAGEVGFSVWDSRRNRVLVLQGTAGGAGFLWAYDPAAAAGSRVTPIRNNLTVGGTNPVPNGVYDARRDQLRIYAPFPDQGGQFGVFSFSSNGGTANNPHLGYFLPSSLGVTYGGAGSLYDPVADRDVFWIGGTDFTPGGGGSCGFSTCGDRRTLDIVNPDTYALTRLVVGPVTPDLPTSGIYASSHSIWSRFAYLPTYDAYAVIPDTGTTGVNIFAPDRVAGPLAALPSSAAPRLLFTDLTQANRTGNGDTSKGQSPNVNGALVTVWGQNLGLLQGTSTVTIGGVPPTAVYYWGAATAPNCGAANLTNNYQALQCIIFQVAATTPTGAQNIVATVNGVVSSAVSLNVTTTGTIYFAATGGGGAGTYGSPFASIAAGLSAIGAGDVLYVMDGLNAPSGVNVPASAVCPSPSFCADGPIAVVVYPGGASQVGDATHDAFVIVNSGGGKKMTYAKFSAYDGGASGYAMWLQSDSRMVGNKIQGPNGTGSTGCVSARGDNLVFVGNEFTNCGAEATGAGGQYHVLYIAGYRAGSGGSSATETNREVGWNYFHDNLGVRAINIFNANNQVGDNAITGHRVHDNVIVTQSSTGIGLLGGTMGDNWVYNNLLVNVGLYAGNEGGGIRLHGYNSDGMSLTGTYYVFNNTILNAGDAGQSSATRGAFIFDNDSSSITIHVHNNLVYQANGLAYVASSSPYTPPAAGNGTKNLWYGAGSPPAFDTTPVNTDPKLVLATSPYNLHIQPTSPAISAGVNLTSGAAGLKDFDGFARPVSSAWDIGAYALTVSPAAPTGLRGTAKLGGSGGLR